MTTRDGGHEALPCPRCGYDLRGSAEASRAAVVICSECGGPVRVSQARRDGSVGHISRDWWFYVFGVSPLLLWYSVISPLEQSVPEPYSLAQIMPEVYGVLMLFAAVLFPALGWWASRREPDLGNRIFMTIMHAGMLLVINMALSFVITWFAYTIDASAFK